MLDVSGSMGWAFPDDSDRRSKLEVAKNCLQSILPQLSPRDRVAIITFNTTQQVIYNLNYATEKNCKKILKEVSNIYPSGGTALANGLAKGYEILQAARNAGPRSQRVLFLTDMQSSNLDEEQVILLGRNAITGHVTPAKDISVGWRGSQSQTILDMNPTGSAAVSSESIFFSIIGIGVDLSVNTLRKVTAIPGARYISASSANEFNSIVAEEFLHDVTPIAFNIRVLLPENYTFNAVYGASELSDLQPGATSITISSEFANPLGADGSTSGGILLLRLDEKESKRRGLRKRTRPSSSMDSTGNNVGQDSVRVLWIDRSFNEQQVDIPVPLSIPSLIDGNSISDNCNYGLRKAVALKHYVSCLEKYALKPDSNSDTDTPAEVVSALLEHQTDGLLALPSLENFPGPIPPSIVHAHKYARLFSKLRSNLIAELGACGDTTLMSNNQNILQTVSQVVDLESLELTNLLREMRQHEKAIAYESAADDSSFPRSFICPITMELMKDPFIAVDGHSYERKAIEKWFLTKSTSPVTNLPLSSTALIENHSLRAAIEQYVDSPGLESGVGGTSSNTNSGSSSSSSYVSSNRTPIRQAATRKKVTAKPRALPQASSPQIANSTPARRKITRSQTSVKKK